MGGNVGAQLQYSDDAKVTSFRVGAGGGSAPFAPSNLAASAVSSSQINLGWQDNSTNETGFKIERKTGSGGSYSQIQTTGANVTTYNNTNLSSGTTYYYRVRATNASGDSGYSNEANATTSSGSEIIYDANDLTIADSSGDNWASVSNSGASGGNFLRYDSNAVNDYITLNLGVATTNTYQVNVRYNKNAYRGIVQLAIDGTNLGSAQDLYASTATFSDVNLGTVSLASGTRAFKFTVTGKNASSADYQIGIDTITLTPAATPAPPSNLTATAASSSQINLSWTDNATNETGFKIERKTGAGGSWSQIDTVGSNVTSYNNTNLSSGTTYFYRVRANNASGDSAYSNEAEATTSGGSFVSDANDLTIAASSGDNVASVSNAGASGGNFLRYDSNAVNDYITFNVSVGTTGTYQVNVRYHKNAWRGIVQLAIDGTGLGSAQDLYASTAGFADINLGTVSLASGTRSFKFTVTGKNASSSDYQIAIDTITLTAVATPAPPSGLSATAVSSSAIDLSWTDNSSNETGFKIERKTGSGGSWSQIDTVSADVTSYSDTGLSSGTTYFYRVRATNVSGDSGFSNEADATTGGGNPVVYEAESLTISASSGDTADTRSDASASGGYFLRYFSNAVDDFVTFSVNVASTQTYQISVRYNKNAWRGIVQLAIDGTNLGSAQDLYASTAAFADVNLGTVSLASGTRSFKFTVTSKNASSADYQIAIDSITLTPAAGGDTTPPTVSITAPSNEATVSGTSVTVSASASDNVGVVGVQFKLDGANLGAEDTSSPYSITWNTTTVADGNYTLTAVARDAADNSTTSSPITVTVSNSPTPPSNLTATAASGTQIDLTWSDNSSNETGFEIQRKTNNGSFSTVHTTSSNVTSWSDTNRTAGNFYTYRVRAAATYPSVWSLEAGAGTPVLLEAESLTVAASSGDTTNTTSVAGASGGSIRRFFSDAVDDYITLEISVPTTLVYEISVRHYKNAWRGISQLSAEGVDLEPTYDAYSSTAVFETVDHESVSLEAGTRTITFTIIGKNASSADYQLGLDSITLTPTGL